MKGEKKCRDCRKVADYVSPKHASSPVCRSCYLAHLKRLAAVYGGANYEDQYRTILVEIRRVEEEQR